MTIPPPPPPPYGQYPPPPPPGYYGTAAPFPPPPQRSATTNTLAIASLVCGFVFFPLGIVFGHVSLAQIKKSHEGGHGLAVAGLIVSYEAAVLTVVAVVATVVFAAVLVRVADEFDPNRSSTGSGVDGTPLPSGPLPPFTPSATLGSNCQYPVTTQKAVKPVDPPRAGRVPTVPATVDATILTNRGAIGVELDNGQAPCTVNNFVSLAQQGFYDDTFCHRLATSDTLKLLQCGDPSGDGSGGPGYRFPNEYPTNQFRLADPKLQAPATYPRGTLAMANTGAGTNGSQFFVVYGDSQLPPTYTVFGSVDETGLAVVDGVAAGGVKDGGDDGKPATGVTITSVRLD